MQEIINIALTIKEKVTDDSDTVWTSFNSPKELRDEIDACIKMLQNDNSEGLDKLKIHFLPTCTFQEYAISNGWGEEYLRLAEQFDKLHAKFRERN